MSKVLHKQIYYNNSFGGVTNTTLCNRVSMADPEGTNITTKDDKISCKFCLKIINNPIHWRMRQLKRLKSPSI